MERTLTAGVRASTLTFCLSTLALFIDWHPQQYAADYL